MGLWLLLSLIELEHTKKEIPGRHPTFQNVSADFKSLSNSMETHHNQLRKSLKGANTLYIYLNSEGLK